MESKDEEHDTPTRRSRRKVKKTDHSISPKADDRNYSAGSLPTPMGATRLHSSGSGFSSSPIARPGSYSSARIRDDARLASSQLLVKQIKKRDELKEQRLEQVKRQRELEALKKKNSERQSKLRMQTSPFLVDLVAESERVDEENRIRLREEMRRQQALEKRKETVKTEIVLRALAEVSDLETLRQEKRNILVEERRLKALLDIEKAKTKRRLDLLAAQRAEKERKAAAGAFRRAHNVLEITAHATEERELLVEKLEVYNDPKAYGISVGKGVIAPLGGACG